MMTTITLELPEQLAASVQEFAVQTDKPIEDILIEWIRHVASEQPVQFLSDEQVLALCDLTLPAAQQKRLSLLLAKNRENQLAPAEEGQLDKLMKAYRRGLTRKAQAWQEAVKRGLKSPLQ